MDTLNHNKHISGQFNAELEHIHTELMTMGGLVEEQLTKVSLQCIIRMKP